MNSHREQLQNMAGRCAEELLALAICGTFKPSRTAALECVAGLSADLWPTPVMRDIARAAASLAGRGEPADLVSVYEEARRLGLAVEAVYLSHLCGVPDERHLGLPGPRVAVLREWAEWQRREQLADALKNPQLPLDQIRRLLEVIEPANTLAASDIVEAGPPPQPVFAAGPVPGTLAVLAGESGRSKSYMSCIWAAQLATGFTLHPAFGADDRRPVMFLSYEDAPEVIRWRLDRIGEAAPGFGSEVRAALETGRLQFYCDLPEPLFANTGGLVQPTGLFARLDALARERRPGLIVIDPLSGAAALRDENSSAEVNIVAAGFAELARRHDCAVLVVHHTAKSNADNASQHSLRGSSALAGRARWIAQTTPHQRTGTLVLSVVKNSYHRAIEPVLFHQNEHGVPLQLAQDKTDVRQAADFIAQWLRDHPEAGITEGGLRRRKGDACQLRLDLDDACGVLDTREVEVAVREAVAKGWVRRKKELYAGRKREVLMPVKRETA